MFLIGANPQTDHRIAIRDFSSGRSCTVAELAQSVDELSSRFRAPDKQLIFLYCNNDVATVLAYLSAIESGHAVALLDQGLDFSLKQRLVDIYTPELVVESAVSPSGSGHPGYNLTAIPEPALRLWNRNGSGSSHIHPDLTLLLSTSGSTGTPKFVRLSRANVESNALAIGASLRIGAEDRPITSLPIHYSYGLSVVNSHLAARAEIVVTAEALTSPGFWEAFRNHQCTSLAGVPYSYQVLRRLNLDNLKIPSLATLTQAGGKMSNELIQHFHRQMTDRNGRMFVMYGQTEASPRIAAVPAERLPEKIGSAGQALPGGRLAVSTGDELTTEPCTTGEIVYWGPNVMLGYARERADLELGDTLGGCLYTGDTGHLDAEGFLYVTGRRKRDAKVFGMRLNMDEVEEMMRVHGPLAVVSSGERLVLYCEQADAGLFPAYARELAARLKLHVGAFEFRRIEQLPLMASGKVDYATLEKDL